MCENAESGAGPLQLFADYSVDRGASNKIAISRLCPFHCRFSQRVPLDAGTPVTLWIGAVGPLAGVIACNAGGDCRLDFAKPLPSQIVDHFLAA